MTPTDIENNQSSAHISSNAQEYGETCVINLFLKDCKIIKKIK